MPTMVAKPKDPTEKNKMGTSSRCNVSHRVIHPSKSILNRTKVATFKMALALKWSSDATLKIQVLKLLPINPRRLGHTTNGQELPGMKKD